VGLNSSQYPCLSLFFTGLKNQLELSDSLIDDILLQDNELIKFKIIKSTGILQFINIYVYNYK